MTDLLARDATAQLSALRAKDISAVELLKLSLARHEQTHQTLNAVVTADLGRALDTARAMDDLRAKGASLGPLAGLPMTIKDALDVAGMAASSGVELLRRRKPQDAVAVGHVRQAGAVIWAKTNVPVMTADWQSFNPLYGTTNNPWDPARTPGGSSGGAAAALAAGVTALEIGSDIGGSLRVPASFCGVFSHKPTWGLVSQLGHVPPAPGTHAERDLNVIGPMARSARDLRLLLSVLTAGVPAKAEVADLSRLKIGLWLESFPLDPEVAAVIEVLGAQLSAAGAEVRPISSPVSADQLTAAYQTLLGAVQATDMPIKAQTSLRRMRGVAGLALRLGAGPQSWAGLARAYAATHAEWIAADEVRARLKQTTNEAFAAFDVILAPVAPVVAFPHDHRPFIRRRLTTSEGQALPYATMFNWIALATACHLPVTTIPAGLAASGLPVGVQIIGPHGADSRTLAIAQAIDERLGGFIAPPMG
ncbi:amidase family protein [Phenylobacterium sp. Root700]|uniref:amidase family protein n=1 Tax=Phenylobacterium sp. Root700 TaxID=1736591 RepID=UPI0006FBE2B6|nr:amidase family protein [Phenylobacterium sp. Root700]KRB41656.1 amidase [Phenylobacterium sp. Root700]